MKFFQRKLSERTLCFGYELMSKFNALSDYNGAIIISTIEAMLERRNVDSAKPISTKNANASIYHDNNECMIHYDCCDISIPFNSNGYYKFCPNCGKSINKVVRF